jgi:hypothetical protein
MLPVMTSRDQLRAADADRERAASRLHRALEEGRLTLSELDERLQQVYAAKTFGDLDRILADLPEPTPEEHSEVAVPEDRTPVPPSRHEPAPKLPTWLSVLWRLWLAAVLVNLAIWFLVSIASGELTYFWPIWVAGPWGVLNVALTILFPPRRRT